MDTGNGMTLRALIGALNEAVRDGADLDNQVLVMFDGGEYVEVAEVQLSDGSDGVSTEGDAIIRVY